MYRKKSLNYQKKFALSSEQRLNVFFNRINDCLPVPKHIEVLDEKILNQQKGTKIIDIKGDFWYLGFSEDTITPADLDKKTYYVGGNISLPPRKIKGVIDEIRVRSVCISVGNGRGKIILSSVDCIGITNSYVKRIKSEMFDFCKKHNIKSINIFSTHAHSSIDTMGIWSVSSNKLRRNMHDLFNNKKIEPSVDCEYIDFLIDKIKSSIKIAVENMTPGKLYLLRFGVDSSNKIKREIYNKIGFDFNNEEWSENFQKRWDEEFSKLSFLKTGIYEYILSKRSPYDFIPSVTRIRFEPFDKSKRETMIVNLSAHPYSNGLRIKKMGKGNALSADFPFYMEKVFNENGYNFIFFNGAINGVYPNRGSTDNREFKGRKTLAEQTEAIGRDFASIILAANMSMSSILMNPSTTPLNRSDGYKKIVERKNNCVVQEEEIPANLVLGKRKFMIECSNPIEQIIGKLNFSQFSAFYTKDNTIVVESEVGCLILGGLLKIIFIPGEITPGLFSENGDLYEPIKFNESKNEILSIVDIFGKDTIVFGLANDAIGYVIDDKDYCMFYLGNGKLSKKILGKNYTHYQEIFSLGNKTASTIMEQLKKLYDDLKING